VHGKGQVPRYTESGQPIVDANGSPVYTTESQIINDIQPDWLGGVNSSLEYKGVRLGFVLDTRQGGTIYSQTKQMTEFNGTAASSVIYDRKPFVVPNSVVENDDGTFSPNTTAIGVDAFLDDGNYGKYVIDATYVKLREVTLGYSIPKSILSNVKMQQATIQLFVKNPKIWLPSQNSYADPEVNGPVNSTSNANNVETTQIPTSTSLGFNINITF
jgi:hypothetical protein